MPDIKRQFPMLKGITYLNSALRGAPSLSVTDAMTRSIEDWSRHGLRWDDSMNDIIAIKCDYAKLIQARDSEIAIVPSVSAGLVAIASSMNLSEGKRRNGVVSSLNFVTNKVIWRRMQERRLLKTVSLLEPKNGEILLESYEKSIDDNTAVVAIDYVSGFNGFLERVKEISEIAHKHRAILVVDAFHAVGTMPVDVKKIGADVFLSGFTKWMCGPAGAACLYVSGNILERLDPVYLGWQGVRGNIVERKIAGKGIFDAPFQDIYPSESSARFEWGSWSPTVLKGVREALRYVLKTDQTRRYSTIEKRKAELLNGLSKMGLEITTPEGNLSGGGIVAFKIKMEKDYAARLAAKKVIIAANFGRVVASPHFYNTSEDVEEFLEQTSAYVAG